jgi:cytochrome P450
MHGTHRDDATYENPDEFDGFRFAQEKSEDDEDTGKSKARETMYTTSKTYLSFGHGRHAWYAIPRIVLHQF